MALKIFVGKIVDHFLDVFISIVFVVLGIVILDFLARPDPPLISHVGYYCQPNLPTDQFCTPDKTWSDTRYNYKGGANREKVLASNELEYLQPEKGPGTLVQVELNSYDPRNEVIVLCKGSKMGGGYTEQQGQDEREDKVKCPSDGQIEIKKGSGTLHTLEVVLNDESQFQLFLHCKYRKKRDSGAVRRCRTEKDDAIESFKVEVRRVPIYRRVASAVCDIVGGGC